MNSPTASVTVCISCLQPRSLDEDGLCLPCSKSNESMDGALLALLQASATEPDYSPTDAAAIRALEIAWSLIAVAQDVNDAQRLIRSLIESTKANAATNAAGEHNHAGQEQPASNQA